MTRFTYFEYGILNVEELEERNEQEVFSEMARLIYLDNDCQICFSEVLLANGTILSGMEEIEPYYNEHSGNIVEGSLVIKETE